MNNSRLLTWTGAALLALCLSTPALAEPGHGHGSGSGGAHFGGQGGTQHAFPARGSMVGSLPRGGVSINHLDHRYWYHGGSWYSHYGRGWSVVAPPFGIYVPFLPGFYSTLWFGGMPYYYANDVYYAWREPQRAYEVVEPPAGAATPVPDDIYMYPRNGQSEQQQGTDRYECHRWAADQTHFDPTHVQQGEAGDLGVRRAEYFRAMGACLEGRGYSVK